MADIVPTVDEYNVLAFLITSDLSIKPTAGCDVTIRYLTYRMGIIEIVCIWKVPWITSQTLVLTFSPHTSMILFLLLIVNILRKYWLFLDLY